MDEISPRDASILALLAYKSRKQNRALPDPELLDSLESNTARSIAAAMTHADTAANDATRQAAESLLSWGKDAKK